MKKFFSGFIFLILLIVFIGSGFLFFQNVEDEYQYHQMQEQIEEEKQILVEEEYEFKELIEDNEINDDTIGWITIEGTTIDYPIVQASDNSYYLTHDCNGNKSKYGSIFMDYHNAADFSDKHTILYGHNMKNGSMFHDLNDYSSHVYLDEHTYIKVYSQGVDRKWAIFSTYSTEPDFNYLQTAFDSPEEYSIFLNALLSHSEFNDLKVQVSAEDKILTLSTCSDDLENGRRVVHAKLVEEVIDGE